MVEILAIMDLLSSSSDEDDDDILDEFFILRHKEEVPKIQNYIENVVHHCTDVQFQKHFRISRRTCYKLIEIFKTSLFYPSNNFGIPPKTAETHILAFIWYAVNKSTLRSVSERFDMAVSTTFEANDRVMSFLCAIAPSVIRFPRTQEEKENSAAAFETITNIPGVIGAIDGSYMNLRTPAHTIRSTYVNRHDQSSITLQAICDAKLRYIDVFTGMSSKSHDSRIFKNSFIYPIVHQLGPEFHLLADGAYTIAGNVMTPYRDHGRLTRVQENFNYELSRGCVKIENSFALLQSRLRHVIRTDFLTVEKAAQFVLCCCVIHNLGIEDDNYLFNLPELDEERNYYEGDFVLDDNLSRAAGVRKRDLLAASLIE